MAAATVRLYGCLNDFLPTSRATREHEVSFAGTAAARDLIESLGPPHVEVEVLLVDDSPAPFEAKIRGGQRIAAYPAFHALPVPAEARCTPPLPSPLRFILDGHLGTLARHLRLLGFDAAWDADADDARLAEWSDGKVLLTRDVGLLKRARVIHGYWPRSTDPRVQLAEVVDRFELKALARPFTRCLRCNGELRPVEKAAILSQLPSHTALTQDAFKQCALCGQLFWAGSHHRKLQALVAEVLGNG